MKRRVFILFIGMMCMASMTWAQQKQVRGTVTSVEGQIPLIGVTITVQETGDATSTDEQGNYSVAVNEGQMLRFTYIGYQAAERTVGSSTVLNVELSAETSLDEVVVVGYGTQRRSDITGAVTTVDTRVLESRPITDVARGLQGAVPGLSITTSSGQIGQNPSIRLRGMTGTLTGTSGAQPLILVDNVEIPNLQLVNPNDIESVSVLKDAASSSIYGTRGAWGVIQITTKSGKKGAPPRVTYNNNFSFSTPTQTPEIANAADGAELALLSRRRLDPSLPRLSVIGYSIDDIAVEKMREWEQTYGGQNLGSDMVEGRDFEYRDGLLYFYRPWDVGEMYLREWTPQQNHDLSISGGSEKTSYNLGLGYVGQKGVLKVNPDDFNRYNLNLAVNTTVNNWFDARAKVLYSNTSLTQPFTYAADVYDPWYYLYRWPATFPYGTLDGQPFRNAITDVEQAKMNKTTSGFTRLSLGGTIKPTDGLNVDLDYTYSGVNGHVHQTGGTLTGVDFWGGLQQNADGSFFLPVREYSNPIYNRAEYRSSWSNMHTARAVATYDKRFGDHSFKFILGGETELYQFTSHYSQRRGLIDPNMGQPNLATGDQFVGSANNHWNTLGFFGRINYSYKSKYLLELNGRQDGSSRLSPNQKWGFFPSMSAGYVISEEDFMDFAKPTLSFLKFRGSWGAIGNQNTVVGNIYSVLPTVNSGWLIDEQNLLTVSNANPISGALTWETVTTLDFGLDARLLGDRLGVVFDWYRRTTSDMHSAGLALPEVFGAPAPRRNFGALETKGWELAVNYTQQFNSGFNFNATAMLSDFKETLTTFEGARLISGNYKGKMLGEIWGYETDRYFTADDFTTDGSGNLVLKEGIPNQTQFESGGFVFGPGDVKYKDLNGDGVITRGSNTVEDPGDQRVIGNTTPRYQYGLQLGADYKGVDFSLFLQGVGARDYWAQGPMFIPGWRQHEAWYAHQLDYWTEENQQAFYPRPTAIGEASTRNFERQSKYLLDLSYLRVKNLAIGYTFPSTWTDRIKMQRLRIYLSGENLLTFDKLGDIPIDPEVNVTTAGQNDPAAFGRVYPYRTSYSFGIQLTL